MLVTYEPDIRSNKCYDLQIAKKMFYIHYDLHIAELFEVGLACGISV